MTKRGERTDASDTRRKLIKRSYEILEKWRERGYSETESTLAIAASKFLEQHLDKDGPQVVALIQASTVQAQTASPQ